MPIKCIRVSSVPKEKELDYPAFFMTGNIHARELLSLSAHIYFITRIIYLSHKDQDIVSLLQNTNLYFVPIVNVDGLKLIDKHYKKTKKILLIRKNRHSYSSECLSQDEIGVDLNRNFGFGYGKTGSSSYPCSEEFKGSGAFSEPESAAIRDFVESHPNIKTSVDYHSYGNDYILPTTMSKEQINGTVYEEFYKEAGLHKSHKFGNVKDLINYVTSGDVTDWMYGAKNIFAISVEIGSEYEFVPTKIDQAIRDIK